MVPNPTSTIASRVQELRHKRGWSAAVLAAKCAEVGMSTLNRSVLANVESGRRPYVTVEEMLALAYVLDVSPVSLVVPLEVGETADTLRYQVTPRHCLPLAHARDWVRGRYCPPGRDPRAYFSEVPREEWPAAQR